MNVVFGKSRIPTISTAVPDQIPSMIKVPESSKLVFKHRSDFPNVGRPNVLYVATDKGAIYIFDPENNVYVNLGSDIDDVNEIRVYLKEA